MQLISSKFNHSKIKHKYKKQNRTKKEPRFARLFKVKKVTTRIRNEHRRKLPER